MSAELLSFKAGKVDWDPSTKTATPKRGQGLVTISGGQDEGDFYTFRWTPRGEFKKKCTADDEIDTLLFPGDTIWEHVTECTTGRIFSLAYKSSGDRTLFWMQTPNEDGEVNDLTEQDKEITSKIQHVLSASMMDVDEEEPQQQQEQSQTSEGNANANPQTPANR